MKERENISNTEIAAAPESDLPVFSFKAPGQGGATAGLTPEHFNIKDNKFAAFYDSDHRLIFVLDDTRTNNTPNSLLVMFQQDGRKWDDILENDYAMDLEDIRPKINNKYQKLDIDYSGLPVYGQLIADYQTGADIDASLAELDDFRADVGRRIAHARLVAAEREIETAGATIEKANESILALRSKAKSLKAKLAKAQSGIGKKPTKESAAKILKIQSQTDNAIEKTRRAEARLRRAKKRLEDAERDAAAARKALDAAKAARRPQAEKIPPAKETEAALRRPAAVSAPSALFKKTEEHDMADEPKPLFSKDPEIIDEKIAFQPVEFQESPLEYSSPLQEETSDVGDDSAVLPPPAPAADPITVAPVMNTASPTSMTMPTAGAAAAPAPTAPPPPTQMQRPYSPIMGQNISVSRSDAGGGARKPTMLYYVMLIILIGLSVLTLWMYQTKMDGSAVPNLAAPEAQQPAPEPAPVPAQPATPVIEEPAPIVEEPPVQQPEPAPIAEEPAIQPTEPEPVAAEPELVAEPEPIAEPEPAAEPEPNSSLGSAIENFMASNEAKEQPAAAKPEYSVQGPGNYAAESKETGEAADSEVLCTSGAAPDEDGCCAGEVYTDMKEQGFNCCPEAGGECFPPIK